MAYVVIQHLSPEHQSLMAEILCRGPSMPVSQIQDGVSVQPNHVYVIRPGYTMTLKDGRLRLGEPVERRAEHRPVVRAALREAIAERRVVAIELQSETELGPILVTAVPLRHSRPPDYFRVTFESSRRASAQPHGIGAGPAPR